MNWSGEQSYMLKLAMLLFVLQSHQQTYEAWAEIPIGSIPVTMEKISRGRIHTLCRVELSIVQGKVSTCLIRDIQSTQVLFQGRDAIERTAQCGELAWTVRPSQPPLPHQFEPDHTLSTQQRHDERWFLSNPPFPIRQLERSQIESLPRKHRQVLLLVNGERGIGELSHMLRCPPDQLIPLLNDLESWNLITISISQNRNGSSYQS